ncbi:MAG: ABC transporter substrate-binding protein [Acidobacteriaceae bacterium]
MHKMRNRYGLWILLAALLCVAGCKRSKPDPNTVSILIESSPNSLDLRIGVDAQSERIGSLIFDSLLRKDEHFNLQPWLADSWQQPDPLTYIFHLHKGVHFHNGQLLTSADVAWTINSMRDGKDFGGIISPRSGNFASVASVDTPDPDTIVIHLKHPDASLLWNLADQNIGIVPNGSGPELGLHPIGTGPFQFVSQVQDRNVILQRNPSYWQQVPKIHFLRFDVVPDAITRALELQKGSADLTINSLTADMVYSLRDVSRLKIETSPGTILTYINLNTRDPLLKDRRVRQAIACAINRPAIIHALWRDHARIADSILPIGHWAWTDDVAHYPFDPARARALLDAAGYKPNGDGIRMELTMKTSTDETSRLLAAVVQQQLHQVGIQLNLRSYEFGSFYGDITRGAFQLYTLRWISSNEDPDIFRYAYDSSSFPPHGANRGYYSNPRVDALIADASATSDQIQRRADYVQIQKILAVDMPTVNILDMDNVLVYNRRLRNIQLTPSGTYDFLRTATVAQQP